MFEPARTLRESDDDVEFSQVVTRCLSESDASYLEALAVCGSDDELAITLVEKWLRGNHALRRLQNALADLMAKHNGDERFLDRCRAAFSSRANLFALEAELLLDDWEPCAGSRHRH